MFEVTVPTPEVLLELLLPELEFPFTTTTKTKKGKKISSLNSSDPKGYFNVPKEA